MKVGETVPVSIAGETVAQAKVVEMSNETVTLIVPATQVVMAVKTELDTAPVESEGPKVIVESVERPAEDEAAQDAAPVETEAVETEEEG